MSRQRYISGFMQGIIILSSVLWLSTLLLIGSCSRLVTTTVTAIVPTTITTTEDNVIPASSAASVQPPPAVSEDQAFAIAKLLVPADVLKAPSIFTMLNYSQPDSTGIWEACFNGLNITKQELIDFGWRADANTAFGVGETYSQIWILIDAQTGIVISKTAWNGLWLGGGPPPIPLTS